VKTNYEGEARGFHGGKKVKGRSRQIAVDTGGRLWGVHIHAANRADAKEGCALADRVLPGLPSVTALCADAGYRGTFVEHLRTRWQKAVPISTRIQDGFAVLPQRWGVERSLGWFNGQRRLSKDHEKKTAHAEAMLLLAAFTRTLRALAF
jgi:transposase